MDLSRRGSNDGTNDYPHVSVSRSLTLKSSRSSLNLKGPSNTATSSPTSRRASVKEGITFQPVTDNYQPQLQSTPPSAWNIFEQVPEHSKSGDPAVSSLAEGINRFTVSDGASPSPSLSTTATSAQHDSRKPRLLSHSSSTSLRQILSFGSYSEDARTGGAPTPMVKWKLKYAILPIITHACKIHPNYRWLSIHDGVLRIWRNRNVSSGL